MTLDDARLLLDEIDKLISTLLNKRFVVVSNIKKIKEEVSLPITDLKREKAVIDNNQQYILKEYHEQFKEVYQTIIKVSKDIQNLWINTV